MVLKNIKDYLTIKRSGLFDPIYYLYNNPDVRQADVDPLWHFVTNGWKEGRDPSAEFNVAAYLENYPDVRSLGINPLCHYAAYGRYEFRITQPIDQNAPTEIFLVQPAQKDTNRLSLESTSASSSSKIIIFLKKIRDLIFPPNTKRWILYEKIRGTYQIREISTVSEDSSERNERIFFDEYLYNEISPNNTTEIVDIIICVGPNDTNVRACLNSIREYSTKGTYVLHLVVHEQDFERISDLAAPDVKFYKHHMALFNYARANNMAMRECTNDIILLNDDTEVTPGWIEKLKTDSRGIALTGAHTNKFCAGNPQMWDEGPACITKYPINMFCAYIPQRIKEVVGYLDEEYAYYGGEDTDYTCRTLQNGFPLMISSAFVTHKDNQSFKDTKEVLIKETFKLLFEKYQIVPPFDLSNVQPLISVIIATHNRPNLVKNAIKSIEKNSYKNFELIVVDDCSTESTIKELYTLQRSIKNLKIIRLPEDSGSVRARQIGINASSGQYLMISDDDDTVLQNRISSPLNYLIKHPQLDVVYCNFNIIENNGKVTPSACKKFDFDAYLNLEFNIGAGILLGRRSVFTDVPFMKVYDRAVDYDWVFRLLRKGYQIDLCPDIVMNYNRTGSTDTHLSGNRESIEDHNVIFRREQLLKTIAQKRK